MEADDDTHDDTERNENLKRKIEISKPSRSKKKKEDQETKLLEKAIQ